MAFVNRAERKLLLYDLNSEVGPGSYVGHSSYRTNTNYAPFISSTERQTDRQHSAFTPGPGSYIGVLQQNSKRQTQGSSPAFASGRSRFDSKQEKLPGPGSYNIAPQWSGKKIVQKSPTSTNWVRLPSAPSIPGQNQGYGYDETLTGDLVMHKGPQVTPGTTKDSVGPGHYDPKLIGPKKGPMWYKSAAKRSTFLAKSVAPGPGSYAPKVQVPVYKQKPSAVFISSSKRGTELSTDESTEDGVPGPGKYAIQSAFTPSPIRPPPTHFGSGCERFKARTPEPAHLGPGYYEVSSPNFRLKTGESKAPFCSTDPRFQSVIDMNPGPGSYRNADLQKKVWGKQGVCGCTEKRFYNSTTNDLPGPGTYILEKQVGIHNSASHKGHSVFLSKAKRMTNESNSRSPAPGSYDIVSPIGYMKPTPIPLHPILVREDQPTKNVGFNAQADRFFNQKNNLSPGPGSYKIKG